MGMFDFVNDIGNYNSRKVDRTDVGGLTISTAFTSDYGYETAVIDKEHTYPVERYSSREDAKIGHDEWVARAPELKEIVELEGLEGLCPPEIRTLVR